MVVLGVVLAGVVVLAALVAWRSRRGRGADAPVSIRDADWEARAYGEASQGRGPVGSDADRFAGGTGL